MWLLVTQLEWELSWSGSTLSASTGQPYLSAVAHSDAPGAAFALLVRSASAASAARRDAAQAVAAHKAAAVELQKSAQVATEATQAKAKTEKDLLEKARSVGVRALCGVTLLTCL